MMNKKKLKKACIGILSTAMLLTPTLGSSISAHMVDEKPSVSTPAVDLRSALNHLLGEHVFLAVNAMQNGIKGTADFNASAGALLANADDLSAAIASVYGKEAGKAFEGLWKDHIGFFVDYVIATANNDEAGRQAALAELAEYKEDFSTFLASANPNLKADMLAMGLQMHVDQLVKTFDSYVAGNYEITYNSMGEAYAHMFGTGAGLSNAIVTQFPDKFNNTKTATPAAELRVALSLLLSEHVDLAVLAMQKGIDGEEDFNVVAGELMENADKLSAAIASVYGEDAGKAFEGLWKAHIGFFVDYVVATAGNDEAGRQAALKELAEYREDFSTFLAGANPNLDATTLSNGLQMHVNQLVGAFDNYVAGDYEAAYSNIREAHAHMFATATGLSGAIVAQFPDKFMVEHEMEPKHEMNSKIWLKIGSKDLIVNDKTVKTDVAPFVQDGRTYVSLRFVSEALGANVSWNPAKQEVTVKWGDETAVYWVGADTMTLNGMEKQVGANVFIKDGRTQIPLRFFAELMSWDVQWDNNDWSVTLTK
jgi:hypothetical protein